MSNDKKPYIPPHMRHNDGNSSPPPVPVSPPSIHRQPQKASSSTISRSTNIISRWYATEFMALVPYDAEEIEKKNGLKPLTLTTVTDQMGALRGIAEKVAKDLIDAAQLARKETENADVKLYVMARVGKVLFQGDPSVCMASIKAIKDGKLNSKLARKIFHASVSEEYFKEVEKLLTDKCGFKYEREKEYYQIKVKDKSQPDWISCRCTASHDKGIKLYKVEHEPLRHMVTDISCVSKNMDFRIMLNSKRTVENFDDDVKSDINQLISAAVIDPNVKGGLRWPLEKDLAANKFKRVGVRHTVKRILSRDNVSVFFRQAENSSDYHSSTVEDADMKEVSFKLHGLSELLTEDGMHEGSIVDKIQEVINLIWDNLLS